ncbi:MAG: LysR family transcriptional regulator [Firmicutes bacterium]|nr:LysR family transcriptional regulator [Bacillota bacterium]
MELHQLEYVVAVAKHQSFTRAASEINISQSSLSQQIKKLEEELGVKLFERTTRKVKMTNAGNAFLAHAQKVLMEINQSKKTIREYLSVSRGRIKLGVLPVIGHFRITSLLANFQRNYPGVKMEFREGECNELLQMVMASRVHAAFISEASENPHINIHRLIKDHAVLVVNSMHPLAARDSIELAELAREKFILAHPSSGLYKNFAKACAAAGFEPDILYHCNQVETSLELVRENLGVTVLSSQVAQRYSKRDIAITKILPEIPRRISLVTLKDTEHEPVVNIFIKYAVNWASELKKQNQ